MMKTLISLNETSNAPMRHWWEVRGALRAALVLVTVVAFVMCLERDLRGAFRVTVLEPAMEMVGAVVAWNGWLPLGFAIGAGAPAAAAMRRARSGRPSREQGAIRATA